MSDLRHGATLAGYRIEALVGHGSTGSVYSALDVALDRRVALKVLLPELARDQRFRERFLRESRLAASLEHPNIVPIHAVGEADGVLFIAMRYVDGRDLSALLSSVGRLDAERTIGLLGQVAAALDAAHAKGLVHRDVKPGNVLVARHGTQEHVYLCDFGLAKHSATVTSLTGERAVVGTVDYLAPEQIEGLPVDSRVDVYGLGCVLYECLTGVPPYGRENELASILAHLRDAIPPISERRPELPEALDKVIATALAKDRDERYATCGELVAAAASALAGEGPGRPVTSEKATAALKTFLFCDIRGYTSFTREHGDEAGADLAARFAELVRKLAPGFDGELLELRGDEALVVFDSARQALRFALELQGSVAEELPRGVGIGLDAGEAVAVAGGYRGGALNRAARLCRLAGAEDVLATDGVVHIAGKVEGIIYGPRRQERVKGFDEPVTVVPVLRADGRATSETGRARVARSRKALLVAAGVLVVVAAGVAIPLALSGGAPSAGGSNTTPTTASSASEQAGTPVTVSPDVPATSITSFDGESGEPRASIQGQSVWSFVTGDDALYGLDPNAQFLVVVDPAGGQVTDRIAVDRPHRFLPTVEFGSIWYTTQGGDEVVRIDPAFRREVARIALPTEELAENFGLPPGGLARVGDELWVTYGYPTRVAVIDPAGNRVVRDWRLPDGDPSSSVIAAKGEDVWVVYDDGQVFRLDASGDVQASGRLPGAAVDAVAAEGYLWVAVRAQGAVWKVDRDGVVAKQISTGAKPWEMVEANGRLWVSNASEGTVTSIDPRNDETRQLETGHRPLGLAVTGGRIWVGLEPSAAEARAGIAGAGLLTVALPGELLEIDPAAAGDESSVGLAYAVGASLMRAVPSADGTSELVPDLAAAPPEVSDDGRTYTFRIRPGFRFSPPSGEPVTADAVRDTLERVIAVGDDCAFLVLHDIVGVEDFVEGTTDHVDGIGVSGDTISVTLSSPSATLPARLASPCTAVVPSGTPAVTGGLLQPVASAGPYYVDSYTVEEQIVVLPNPNYEGDRPAKLDAVVLTNAGDPESAAAMVEQGRADYAFDASIPLATAWAADGRLERDYGSPSCPKASRDGPCFVRATSSAVIFLQLDTRSGILADVDVRRAISLALDRTAFAKVAEGEPQTRLIGPGIPGFQPETFLPAEGDLAEARALMRGRRVRVVLGVQRTQREAREAGALLREELEQIGVTVDVRLLDDAFAEATSEDTELNAVLGGWIPAFVDPEDAVYSVVSPRSPGYFWPVWFEDEELLDRIDAAREVTGGERPAAWAAVDDEISAQAAFIPLTTFLGRPQLFSGRVGCQAFLPFSGGMVDLGALCLR